VALPAARLASKRKVIEQALQDCVQRCQRRLDEIGG
jgi:hypothetical protein